MISAIRDFLRALLPRSWRGRRTASPGEPAEAQRVAGPLAPRLPAAPAGQRFPVAYVDFSLYDRRRRLLLPVRITYPAQGDHAFPLIAFSHGSGGTHADYALLIRHWAAHGYVCVQPSHADAALPGRPLDDDRLRHWRSRPADISFVYDSIDMIETVVPTLAGRIDTKCLAAGGHSFGAGTAQLLAGARLRGHPGRKQFADSRVRAVLLLSPQGSGHLHGTNAWLRLRSPMMTITGTRDHGRGGGYGWRSEPYRGAPAGNKYLIVVLGGRHDLGGMSRSASGVTPARDEREAGITQHASLAFWDAYLKNDAEAQRFLKQRGLENLLGDDARLERK